MNRRMPNGTSGGVGGRGARRPIVPAPRCPGAALRLHLGAAGAGLAGLQAAPAGEDARPRARCLGGSVFHARLVRIPSLVDGNGRSMRLASNLLLHPYGYPLASRMPEDRPQPWRSPDHCLRNRPP